MKKLIFTWLLALLTANLSAQTSAETINPDELVGKWKFYNGAEANDLFDIEFFKNGKDLWVRYLDVRVQDVYKKKGRLNLETHESAIVQQQDGEIVFTVETQNLFANRYDGWGTMCVIRYSLSMYQGMLAGIGEQETEFMVRDNWNIDTQWRVINEDSETIPVSFVKQ